MSRYKILDQQGLNFITCTVVGWIDIFSRKIYRDILLESLVFCRKEKGLLVFAFVVMSNHIHLIIQAGPDTNNRYFQFWQQDNHPILLYSAPVIWQKVNYIHDNPVRAGIVDKPSDYIYSSARNYEWENKNCLIEIDLLEPWFSDVGKV